MSRQLRRLMYAAMAVERGTLRMDEALHLLRHRAAAWQDLLRTPLDRRRFLGGASLGFASVSALGLLPACRTMDKASATQAAPAAGSAGQGKRVVIVGAGTAGLTTAYRLHKAGVRSSVYEAGKRVGGRMYTHERFNRDGMFVERGGELVDTQHVDLISLCGELGLEIQELANDPSGASRELYYGAASQRSDEEMIEALRPIAQAVTRDGAALVLDGEKAFPSLKSPLAQRESVQRLDRLSLEEYLAKAGGERWVVDLLTVIYVGEFGLESGQQSALNLLTLFDPDVSSGLKVLGSSDESKRIRGGNENLPRALSRAIASSVPVHMEHRLLAVRDKGTSFELSFDAGGRTVDVAADQVVLAIPVSLLREVDLKGLELPPPARLAIEEWGFGTNAKLMVGLKSRVWQGPEVPGGFVLYTDTETQELWDTSRGQVGSSGIVTNFRGGEAGRIATPAMHTRALADMSRVFAGASAAYDGNKLLQHWPSEPFVKGSYTCLMPGQYTTIYGALSDPVLDGRLVFAGEHSSIDWSGFMNGAVESGNNAAKAVLART
jgi:monoamine oxidase